MCALPNPCGASAIPPARLFFILYSLSYRSLRPSLYTTLGRHVGKTPVRTYRACDGSRCSQVWLVYSKIWTVPISLSPTVSSSYGTFFCQDLSVLLQRGSDKFGVDARDTISRIRVAHPFRPRMFRLRQIRRPIWSRIQGDLPCRLYGHGATP